MSERPLSETPAELAKRLAEALVEVLGGYASEADIEIPVKPSNGRVAVVTVRLGR